jgi:hypothetical protein
MFRNTNNCIESILCREQLLSQTWYSKLFMEPESSLPCPQASATCLYPYPDEPSPFLSSHFYKTHVNISSNLRLGLLSGFYPSASPTKSLHAFLVSPVQSTCTVRLIVLHLNIFTISGEENKLWSSSLHNFLQCLIISSFLHPNFLILPCSQTPSVYIHPSIWQNKYCIHIQSNRELTVLCTIPNPRQMNPVDTPLPHIYKIPLNIALPYRNKVFQVDYCLKVFRPKCMNLSFRPTMLHALPLSFILIWLS